MIPANVFELPSMAGVLAARGDDAEEAYRCPCCPRVLAPDGFCDNSSLPNPEGRPRFVCYTCASHAHRAALAQQEADEEAVRPPWETEAAAAFRAERDRRVNGTLWTTAEGSPLTPSCRDEWGAWRVQMHRLTQAFASPAEVVWPAQPTLAYAPEEEAL